MGYVSFIDTITYIFDFTDNLLYSVAFVSEAGKNISEDNKHRVYTGSNTSFIGVILLSLLIFKPTIKKK